MYFQDLSDEQIQKVAEMLKQDPEVATPHQKAHEEEEAVDDWMNRNNTTETVLACLKKAYE